MCYLPLQNLKKKKSVSAISNMIIIIMKFQIINIKDLVCLIKNDVCIPIMDWKYELGCNKKKCLKFLMIETSKVTLATEIAHKVYA